MPHATVVSVVEVPCCLVCCRRMSRRTRESGGFFAFRERRGVRSAVCAHDTDMRRCESLRPAESGVLVRCRAGRIIHNHIPFRRSSHVGRVKTRDKIYIYVDETEMPQNGDAREPNREPRTAAVRPTRERDHGTRQSAREARPRGAHARTQTRRRGSRSRSAHPPFYQSQNSSTSAKKSSGFSACSQCPAFRKCVSDSAPGKKRSMAARCSGALQ